MAITSPGLSISIEAMFACIAPVLTKLQRLGVTDLAADAPVYDVKPGTTIKIPISSVSKANAYNETSNNYLTGGTTAWASLTATHYLQGFDLAGVDIDQGVNAARIKQLFARRAGYGIAMALQDSLKTALDSTTVSTAVTLPTEADLAAYMGLGASVEWLDRSSAGLAVNGSEYARIKAVLAAAHLAGKDEELASYLGFNDLVLIPGMTARALIVPPTAMATLTRVPTAIARFQEVGVETDPDTGLSVGIIVADDQAKNRQVVNADIWAGVAVQSCAAAATTPGIIKVGAA